MRVIKLEAENIKRLKAVEITPGDVPVVGVKPDTFTPTEPGGRNEYSRNHPAATHGGAVHPRH